MSDFPDLLEELSKDFDDQCQKRHEMGQEKYGPVKFLSIDSVGMMMEEIIDMANYARYNYIKLRLIQMYLEGLVPEEATRIDPDHFFSNKERKLH